MLLAFPATAQKLPLTGTPGLNADYYRGYFYDDLSFFSQQQPGISNRRVMELNFPATEKDVFDVGNVAVYYSPGNPDEFSARYVGRVFILTPGTYTFYLGSDDSGSLWLDDDAQPVVANYGDQHSFREVSATRTLSVGLHTLRLYYGEHGGSQGLVLKYDGPNMIKQLLPSGVLYTESEAAISPVLSSFSTTVSNQQVLVDWKTVTEQSSIAFVVEHSTDGVHFTEVAQLKGAGTSVQPHGYQWTDASPIIGLNYYRLRQTRSDIVVYSPIRTVEVEKVPVTLDIYPVPNNGTFFLRMTPAIPQVAALQLVDMMGRTIYKKALTITNQAEYRIFPDVPVGVYYLKLVLADRTVTRRIVIGH